MLVVESSRFGGLRSQAGCLAGRLAERGFEPHLAVLTGRDPRAETLGGAAETHFLGRRHAFDPFAACRLRRLVARLRPAAVHAWGATAADYAVGAPSRLVATIGRAPTDRPAWRRLLDRRLRRSIDQIVAPSEAVAAAIDAHGGGGVMVIPPGVAATPADAPPRSELFAELGLPAEARVVAVAARMLPRKGVKELIWTADLLRVIRDETRLVVVGDGPELPALRRFARLASDLEHIRLLGGRADTTRLLAAADVFWHAGDEASAPVAVLEAMAAGVPVVADDTPGARLAIDDGESGRLVGRAQRAERARVTEALLSDAAQWDRIGQAGKRSVAEKFAAGAMADAYAALYRAG